MYVQNQPMLIPPSYEDLVPLNHPVRVVNEVIERIDIGALEASYKGGGTSSYHPRMLLKVLVYAYLRDTYSSRKIEQALKENVHFMWLSGGAKPEHYILNYTLGQTTADTTLLKDHIEDTIESYGEIPESLTADAGYGSEENYDYLEEKGISAYVKYGYFDKEQRDRKYRENPFIADKLHYNCETDIYTCPIGQAMTYTGDKKRKTANGFIQTHRLYQAKNCESYPMRGPCHKAAGNRIIQRSPNLNRHRQKIKELLMSEEGVERRKQRWKVEAVFGNIKHNKGFKRFFLRGLEKVNTELGLIAIAHNLQRFSHAPAI